MQARAVRADLIPMAWPLVEGWVRAALKKGKGHVTAQFVRECLERDTMRLWLAWDEDSNSAIGCCIAELLDSARGRALNLVVIAGADFQRWRSLVHVIKAFARSRGCVRLQSSSRPGMVKLMKADGWHPLHTIMELRIDDDG